jgi:hypothetical protein
VYLRSCDHLIKFLPFFGANNWRIVFFLFNN